MNSSGAWLLRSKAVLAHAVGFEDGYGIVGVFVKYDKSASEGSLSLRFAAHVEGSGAPLSLTLLVRPENISHCQLSIKTDHDYGTELGQSILDLITDSAITKEDDLIRLTLTLHAPGRVICPLVSLPIHPLEPQRPGFVAFSRLCQATRVRIYLGKSRIQPDVRARLEEFVQRACQKELRTNPLDLRRLGNGQGRGAQECDWSDIYPATLIHPSAPPTLVPSSEPPPYDASEPGAYSTACAAAAATGRVKPVKKRPRQVTSSSPAPERQPPKRAFHFTPPLGSPTEVNTPSTRDTGGSDDAREGFTSKTRPGRFVPSAKDASCSAVADSPIAERVRELGAMLKSMPPEAIQNAFQIAFGSSPAMGPHKATAVDADTSRSLSPSPETSHSLLKTEAVLASATQSPPPVVDARLRSLVDTRMAAFLELGIDQKLELLLNEKLPSLTDNALQGVVDNAMYMLENNHALIDIELRETADDAIVDMHQARDEGIGQVDSAAQQGIDSVTEHVNSVVDALDTIVASVNDLKSELQTLLTGHRRWMNRQPSHALQPALPQDKGRRRSR